MRRPILFYSCPDQDGDLRYFGGFSAPDPFIAMGFDHERLAVVSSLEYGRAQKESRFTKVIELSSLEGEVRQLFPDAPLNPAKVIACLGHKLGFPTFTVPPSFPVGLARELEGLGLQIEVGESPFIPGRASKTPVEATAIRRANHIAAQGLKRAETILREATISHGYLIHQGKRLSSEVLRREIEIACLSAGGRAEGTIAAGGDQACDPHQRGHGPLRAHQLIIVDVFPQCLKTGYFGDMSRTFLKGTPSDSQTALVGTVRNAQKAALQKVRSGILGNKLYHDTVHFFTEAGYTSGKVDNHYEGFIHGLGHGLGLEIHEAPNLGSRHSTCRLPANAVVTIEPGLYYPGLGACRIEDVVWLKPEGSELLSRYPYRWILP
ncbi:MAG: M24 family metallopeptidase [Puniceicoccaceae bacterium]